MVKVGADGEEGTDRGWASLTDAELRVVSWVSGGMTNRSIAEELCLSRHTVDAHLKHVYLKLDIHSRVELTVLAMSRWTGSTCYWHCSTKGRAWSRPCSPGREPIRTGSARTWRPSSDAVRGSAGPA